MSITVCSSKDAYEDNRTEEEKIKEGLEIICCEVCGKFVGIRSGQILIINNGIFEGDYKCSCGQCIITKGYARRIKQKKIAFFVDSFDKKVIDYIAEHNINGKNIKKLKNKNCDVDPYTDWFEDSPVHGKIKELRTLKDPITGKYWQLPVDENGDDFTQCDGEYYHDDEVPYWSLDEDYD